MDWNNDGKKDLIVGERNGTIRIYLNTNTDENPLFSGYTFLKIGAANYDCGLNSHPFVTDWNNDGLFDLVVGEDYGKVHLLLNIGTPGNPTFETPTWLQDGASNLTTGNEASPAVVDWDRDGKKDLLCGNYNGNVYFWKNVGTDENPQFNGKVYLKADGVNLDVVYYARIDVADWNNDGVMDLLSGNRNYSGTPVGGVWYFEANGPLSSSASAIPETKGAIVRLDLNGGLANANRNYLMLGSVTGTVPGTTLPGGQAVLPLNWDLFTNLVISLLNTPAFSKFMGTLNNQGASTATFNTLGPIPGMAGITLTFAYGLNGPWDFASNGVNIEIIP